MLQSRIDVRLAAAVALTVLSFLSAPALAKTYYVDGDRGDDAHDGLAKTFEGGTRGPRKTWAWFVGQHVSEVVLKSGDRVLFKRGTTLSRDEAGRAMRISNIDDVYFGAYGDKSLPRPIFDSQGEMGLHIGYNGPTHRLTFEDLKWVTSLPRPKGEIITAYANDEPGGYAEGVTFRRVEVDATNQTGTAVCDETVTFTANNVTIEDCYVHDGGRTGIYVAGAGNMFQRNVIENYHVGLKLNHENRGWGTPKNVVVRHNRFINTGIAIELGVCDHNDLYANVMIGTGPAPVEDPRQFGVQIEGEAHDNNVFNNTIILSGKGGDHHGVRMYQDAGRGNVFQNNIVYFHDDDDNDDYLFYQGQNARMPHADYNLYFTDGPTRWYRDRKLFLTLRDWNATKGKPDEHSLLIAPRFTQNPNVASPRDLSIVLSTDSPAVNAGAPVKMHTRLPYKDFFGKPYVGRPDIGAFELGERPR